MVPEIYLDIVTEFFTISIVLTTVFYAGRKDGRLPATGFISKVICSNTTTSRVCTVFDPLPRETRYQETRIYIPKAMSSLVQRIAPYGNFLSDNLVLDK
jgi:hypothetical protein